VLEFQDPATWQTKPWLRNTQSALTHAVIGLARPATSRFSLKCSKRCNALIGASFTDAEKIDYLRAYQLAFIRMGMPDADVKDRVAKAASTPGIRPSRAR